MKKDIRSEKDGPQVPRYPKAIFSKVNPKTPLPQVPEVPAPAPAPSSTSSDSLVPESEPEDSEADALRGELRDLLESGRFDELPPDTRDVLAQYADGRLPNIREIAAFLTEQRGQAN